MMGEAEDSTTLSDGAISMVEFEATLPFYDGLRPNGTWGDGGRPGGPLLEKRQECGPSVSKQGREGYCKGCY